MGRLKNNFRNITSLSIIIYFSFFSLNYTFSQSSIPSSPSAGVCIDESSRLSLNVKDIYCNQYHELNCEEYLSSLDEYLRSELTDPKCKSSKFAQIESQNNSTKSEGSFTENMLLCSPVVLALAHEKLGNMIPKSYFFGSEYIQKILLSKGFKSIGSFMTAGSFIITTAIFIENLLDSLKNEKECQSPIRNQSLMETLQKVDHDLQSQLQSNIPKEDLHRVAFPEAYTQPDFVKNLTCQKIKEILINQKRKYDQLLGPLIAQNKIQTDPRSPLKNKRFSDQDIDLIDDLKKHWACFPGVSAVKLTCLLSNLGLSGKSLSTIYKRTLQKTESSVLQSIYIQKYLENRSILPLTPLGFRAATIDTRYAGENIEKYESGRITKVEYFSELEKIKYSARFKDGKILYLDSHPISSKANTSLEVRRPIPNIFIIDLQGRLILAPFKQIGKLHHSSLSAGEPVMMAGEMIIRNGQIVSINNKSGHFKPKKEHIEFMKQYLKDNGVDISKIQFSLYQEK